MRIAALDIECLSLSHRTIIHDIGLVIRSTTEPDQELCLRPSITEQVTLQRECSEETVDFHVKVWNNDRKAFLKHLEHSEVYKTVSIADCHAQLKAALKDVDELWINGLSFDPGRLTSLFEDVGLKLPYYFRIERDVRTVVPLVKAANLYPAGQSNHDALSDAHWALGIGLAYNQICKQCAEFCTTNTNQATAT